MPLPAKREGCIACCVHKEFGRAARAHVKPWVLLGNGGDGPMISGAHDDGRRYRGRPGRLRFEIIPKRVLLRFPEQEQQAGNLTGCPREFQRKHY